jgi:predicted acyltransferase
MLAGRIILQNRDMYQRITWLFLAGFGLFVAGGAWDWFFPINKHIWTSSYVCHTSGLAFMTLAACHLVVDVLGMDRWTAPGRIFGANAITAYTLAGMLTAVFYTGYFGKPGLNEMWMSSLTAAGIPAQLASLTYALLYVGIIFLPVYQLYRKKIFIRL